MRMERFYEEFVFRTLIDKMEAQRDLIVAALYANSGLEKPSEAIQGVHNQYQEVIEYLKDRAGKGFPSEQEETEIDEDNPFYTKAEEGAKRMLVPHSSEDEGAFASDLVEGEQALQEITQMIS